MIKITLTQLKELKACEGGIVWFKKQKNKSLKSLINKLIKDTHFDYAKWLLVRLLTKEQKQLWAIQSAESVLSIFETKYPSDSRPRKAIQAAKDFLAGKITADAVYAAESAARSAAWSAARSAAWSAARSAAESAARSAESAAESAVYAAAYTAADSKQQKQIEICNYALTLLGE